MFTLPTLSDLAVLIPLNKIKEIYSIDFIDRQDGDDMNKNTHSMAITFQCLNQKEFLKNNPALKYYIGNRTVTVKIDRVHISDMHILKQLNDILTNKFFFIKKSYMLNEEESRYYSHIMDGVDLEKNKIKYFDYRGRFGIFVSPHAKANVIIYNTDKHEFYGGLDDFISSLKNNRTYPLFKLVHVIYKKLDYNSFNEAALYNDYSIRLDSYKLVLLKNDAEIYSSTSIEEIFTKFFMQLSVEEYTKFISQYINIEA